MKGRMNELVALSKILVCYPGLPRSNCYRVVLNKLTDEKKKKKKKKKKDHFGSVALSKHCYRQNGSR